MDNIIPGAMVWAKTDMQHPESVQWLSLPQHLMDTEGVSHHIWHDYLPERTRTMLDNALNGHGETVLAFLAGAHDVGKATPAFESQGSYRHDLMNRLEEHGLIISPNVVKSSRLRHETSGFVEMSGWMKNNGIPVKVADSLSIIIGGHHGVYHNRTKYDIDSNGLQDYYGDETWEKVRLNIIEWMNVRTGFNAIMHDLKPEPIPLTIQSMLTACVVMSDWMASNNFLFPLLTEGTINSENDEPERVRRGWSMMKLPKPWTITKPESTKRMLETEFGLPSTVEPNPMQSQVVDIAAGVHEPSMLIIESPMGSGKTEAALMAAHHIAYNTGAGGVAFALPTQATADGILPRMAEWIPKVTGGHESIELVHGAAGLNENYAELKTNGVYDDETGNGASVNWWFDGSKRGMLANFVVCTIDQVLLAALQAKHFDLRHLGLSGKVVIIDEVHAADDYMCEYLKRALAWLAAMGTSVILMSATLPEDRRSSFIKAYSDSLHRTFKRSPMQLNTPDGYPLITKVNAHDVEFETVDQPMGRNVTLSIEHTSTDEELISLMKDALSDGGSACIIKDTVRSAQAMYDTMLANGFSENELMLAHARFTGHTRARINMGLEEMFGRAGEYRPVPPDRFVVIGTQVLEQSLDIDFDIMATDIAPMDLILQRAGRLHRHERKRPVKLEKPRLIITGWRTENDKPDIDTGVKFVYGFGPSKNTSKVLRSISMLNNIHSISLPSDIRPLVSKAYHEGPWPGDYANDILKEDKKRLDITGVKMHTADSGILRYPYDIIMPPPEKNLFRYGYALWGSNSLGEDTASDEKLTAKVRDSGSSLSVILMRREGDAVTLVDEDLADKYGLIDMSTIPDKSLSIDIRSQSVGLPAGLSNPGIIDSVIRELEPDMPASWADAPLLKGELVVFLDENGDFSVEIGGRVYTIHYDEIRGVCEEHSK